ncbi:MAG: TonB family protein [Gammaproteobacteria bacterium]|nr:TonB family protein [Gammaproteobacteria bacterium]
MSNQQLLSAQLLISRRSINPLQWTCCILLAILLHLILLPYSSSEKVTIKQLGEQQSITLSLSKIHAEASNPVPVVKPKQKTPAKKKIEKKTVKKEKLKKPPVLKQKPKVVEAIKQPVEKRVVEEQAVQPAANAAQSTRSVSEIDDIRNAYLRELSLWLNKHKFYPSNARRRGQEGEVILRFVITANGELIDHELISRAVFQSLNKEALNMVKRASPLPSVPLEIQAGAKQFEYSIPIKFSLQ